MKTLWRITQKVLIVIHKSINMMIRLLNFYYKNCLKRFFCVCLSHFDRTVKRNYSKECAYARRVVKRVSALAINRSQAHITSSLSFYSISFIHTKDTSTPNRKALARLRYHFTYIQLIENRWFDR